MSSTLSGAAGSDFEEQASADERNASVDLAEGDFVADFFAWASMTQDERSPAIYRKWCAIVALACALERRVWVRTGLNFTFCHQYMMFAAPPGTGKSIIRSTRNLLEEVFRADKTPAFRSSPTNMTKASLVDALASSTQTIVLPDGNPYTYSSLFVVAEEFAALLSEYDLSFIGFLNEIYNCDKFYKETRRSTKLSLDIPLPMFNILTGIQPAFMATFFPEEAWSTGLARRMTMIYCDERRIRDPFAEYGSPTALHTKLLAKLTWMAELYGELRWSHDGAKYFRSWVLAGEPPVPTHSKLGSYNTTRGERIMKLAGLSRISRASVGSKLEELQIERIDAIRAIEWLLDAERTMPDVFKAMLSKSDFSVIEELWRFLQVQNARGGNKGVPGALVHKFVGERTTSEKVDRILDLAQKSNMVAQVDSIKDLWAPKAKHLHVGGDAK